MFLFLYDPILVLDPSHDRILDANPQACALLKYSHDEFLSLAVSDIHPQDLAELKTFMQSVLDHGTGWTAELTCRAKTGKFVPVEISAGAMTMRG